MKNGKIILSHHVNSLKCLLSFITLHIFHSDPLPTNLSVVSICLLKTNCVYCQGGTLYCEDEALSAELNQLLILSQVNSAAQSGAEDRNPGVEGAVRTRSECPANNGLRIIG